MSVHAHWHVIASVLRGGGIKTHLSLCILVSLSMLYNFNFVLSSEVLLVEYVRDLSHRTCNDLGDSRTVTATVFVFAKIGEFTAQRRNFQ